VCPAKQVSRKIKGNDASATGLECSTGSYSPADHQEHEVGRISLTYDYVVAIIVDGASSKCPKSALYSLLISERRGISYRRDHRDVMIVLASCMGLSGI